MKLVTVIILSYKNTDGIYETLDSVLQQDYDSIEIIFSDDATPDFNSHIDSLKHYIAENQRKNIKNIIFNAIPQNVGTVKNINSALRLAQGDYIKLISSEDRFSDKTVLTKFVQFMENSEYEICFCKVRGVTDAGKYIYELLACESDYKMLENYTVKQTRNYLFRRNFLPAPGAFMKKSLFDKYGLFMEDTRLIEDYPYWLHLTRQGVSFGYMDEVLIDYRLSGVSSTGSYSEAFMEDMLVIYDKHIFPYDKRFGVFQEFYNFLKRQGLNFYIAKAKWHKYNRLQKMCAYLKYGIFYLYTGLQNMIINIKNSKGK